MARLSPLSQALENVRPYVKNIPHGKPPAARVNQPAPPIHPAIAGGHPFLTPYHPNPYSLPGRGTPAAGPAATPGIQPYQPAITPPTGMVGKPGMRLYR